MVPEMNKRRAELYLGLSGTYDQRALRKAYAREARRWHPDLQPNDILRAQATQHMAQINEAYAYLKKLFRGGAKTIRAERSGGGSSSSWQGNEKTRGTGRPYGTGPSRSRSSGAQPPVVVPKEPAGVPVAPEPEPKPAPPPRHCLAYRIVEHFPWRIAFLALILALFVSPDHAGWDYVANFGRFQWITLYRGGFLDLLLWQCILVPLAVVNLFNGMITEWVQLLLLEAIAWLERLAYRRAHGTQTS